MAVSCIPFSVHLFAFFYLFFFPKTVTCDPRATEAALVCSKVTAPSSVRTAFVSNFVSSLDALTPQVSDHGYAKVIINGTVNTTVFAFGECMKDLSQSDCNLCFAQAKIRIVSCLPFQLLTRGGRLFYDGCYIRYDQYDFFAEGLSSVDTTVCGNASSVGGNLTVFSYNAIELVKNLSAVAPKTGGFAVGSFNGSSDLPVYGLAQCWEFVNQSTCEECLNKAVTNISSCTPKEEGRVLNAGCYLRYSTQKFYDNSTATAVTNGGNNRVATALAATFGSFAFVLIVAFALFIVRKKQLKKEKERKQLGALLATVNKSKLNFSYETLEKATNYFSNSNKLGQGGSGSVFKGILPDGKPVAVKRLFFNTRQWVDHFFNEVDLISGIHHKNLVKLLGCSIIGPESLLVYEFVPNGSLHDHIFGNRKSEPLQWGVRYSIILGTAEGLAHLHEESHARIIHRDIKLSNVLIDVDFTAKIADFGLARLFPEDKSHISTAIAGTLGYMAPEYVVRGKLTEKADVYSFGVLVIEVVSGKRSNSFSQNAVSILQTVWNLYGTGRLHEAVDPVLRGNFQQVEASRLLQIGLLCTQASAEMRPSMSVVVKMLTQNQEIPQPTQPPFLNTNSTELAPTFPPQIYNSQSQSQSSGNELTESFIEPR